MKSKKYWENRVSKTINQAYEDIDKDNLKLKQFYINAIEDLEREIIVTLSKINNGKPTLSEMYKFNRLNKLKKNMNKILKTLGEDVEYHTKNQIVKAINQSYKEISVLITKNFSEPSEFLIKKLIENPWSGELFSNRVWDNQKILNKNLNKTLKNGLIQGKAINKISQEMSNFMNSNFKNINRLVRTETMHFLNEAAKESFKQHNIKKVEVLIAGDERTCPKCMEHDGVIYPINSITLPIHPNCRCCFIPVIEEVN